MESLCGASHVLPPGQAAPASEEFLCTLFHFGLQVPVLVSADLKYMGKNTSGELGNDLESVFRCNSSRF